MLKLISERVLTCIPAPRARLERAIYCLGGHCQPCCDLRVSRSRANSMRRECAWFSASGQVTWHVCGTVSHFYPASAALSRSRSLIPSMRTNGSAVGEGHWRRSAGRRRPMERDRCQRGCCTFVLHVASSSRSQVRGPSPWGKTRAGLRLLSASVQRRVLTSAAIVTQFVTNPLSHCGAVGSKSASCSDSMRLSRVSIRCRTPRIGSALDPDERFGIGDRYARSSMIVESLRVAPIRPGHSLTVRLPSQKARQEL